MKDKPDAERIKINELHDYCTKKIAHYGIEAETRAFVECSLILKLMAAAETGEPNKVELECAGPFVSAFDCPVHDPRKAAPARPAVAQGGRTPEDEINTLVDQFSRALKEKLLV